MNQVARKLRNTRIVAWKNKGWSVERIAAKFGLSAPRVYVILHKAGAGARNEKFFSARALSICQRFTAGELLTELGAAFSLSRERIRQILKVHGLTGADGGAAVRAAKRAAAKKQAREKVQNERYFGLPQEEFKRVFNNGRGLNESGSFYRAYKVRQNNSRYKGLSFRLSFADWIEKWNEAGGWEEGSNRRRELRLGMVDKQSGFVPDNVKVMTKVQVNATRGGMFAAC